MPHPMPMGMGHWGAEDSFLADGGVETPDLVAPELPAASLNAGFDADRVGTDVDADADAEAEAEAEDLQ